MMERINGPGADVTPSLTWACKKEAFLYMLCVDSPNPGGITTAKFGSAKAAYPGTG